MYVLKERILCASISVDVVADLPRQVVLSECLYADNSVLMSDRFAGLWNDFRKLWRLLSFMI